MGIRSALELDLFTTESKAAKTPIFERRRSFRDIQGVITKMNPEVVKSVIANKSSSLSVLSSPPNETHINIPLCDPATKLRLTCGYENNAENTAPMTIFYNGMVAVFDVSPNKAKDILKVAEEGLTKTADDQENLSQSLNGDLPITRRNSLQKFLEKRKERVSVDMSPYYFLTNYSYSSQSPSTRRDTS
ncbi:hypothetical protein DH2020_003844 [Rehmannia glutinosa]|uniref:Protein TIFY n=1 Tax=Rehmannia glutinosa TaxID=99300 RepID=A0ABR0XMV8_REHGL